MAGIVSTSEIMDTKRSVRRKVWPEALKREIVAGGIGAGRVGFR